jgi:hypothetical protein
LIQKTRTHMNDGIRSDIQKAYVPANYGVSRTGHPHPDAANERNASTVAITSMIKAMGYKPYVISPSKREEGADGIRMMYCAADLNQDVHCDEITENHIIMGTDVDYYADLHELCSHARPIILYTFNPTRAAGVVSEGHFTICDNKVRYLVAGGKTVEHPVWDYSQDVVFTDVYHDSILSSLWRYLHRLLTGLPTPSMIASHVDMWEVSSHRRVVAITPYAMLPSLFATALQGERLKHMDYSMGHGFHGVVDYGVTPATISLARSGQLACATLPLCRFQAMQVSHRLSKAKLLGDTSRRSELSVDEAPILHEFLVHSSGVPAETYSPRLASHYTVVTPNPTPADLLDAGKTYARRYAPPPLGIQAVFPTLCEENARASIDGRVTKPQRTAVRATSTVMAIYHEYATDFVDLVVGKAAGTGIPLTLDEVNERQNRPAQRVRTAARDMDLSERFRVKAFTKREAYNVPNDPRNISSCPTMHTLGLSSYTLALKDELLKKQTFYVPGATPCEIAERLMDLAAKHEVLVETDFSRFDGHINEFLRERVEFPVYRSYFHPSYRKNLNGFLRAELNPKARLDDVKYEPGCSRLSGSPLTTDGNTLINAFAQYVIQRKNGYTRVEAFNHLGLICGDDAVVPECGITTESRTKITMKLGLPMKVARTASAGKPIGFLSRVFVDLWTTPASIQAPLRTLLKIHTTVDTVSELMDAGIAKATGYKVTDSQTPIIGNWVRCYLRQARQTAANLPTRDVPYYSTAEFVDGPWPQSGDLIGLVAEDLGVSEQDVAEYCDALDQYNGEIDKMPQMALPPLQAKITAVVDGEIHQAGASSDSNVDQGSEQETLTDNNSDGIPTPRSGQPHAVRDQQPQAGHCSQSTDSKQPGPGLRGHSAGASDGAPRGQAAEARRANPQTTPDLAPQTDGDNRSANRGGQAHRGGRARSRGFGDSRGGGTPRADGYGGGGPHSDIAAGLARNDGGQQQRGQRGGIRGRGGRGRGGRSPLSCPPENQNHAWRGSSSYGADSMTSGRAQQTSASERGQNNIAKFTRGASCGTGRVLRSTEGTQSAPGSTERGAPASAV